MSDEGRDILQSTSEDVLDQIFKGVTHTPDKPDDTIDRPTASATSATGDGDAKEHLARQRKSEYQAELHRFAKKALGLEYWARIVLTVAGGLTMLSILVAIMLAAVSVITAAWPPWHSASFERLVSLTSSGGVTVGVGLLAVVAGGFASRISWGRVLPSGRSYDRT